MRWLLLSLLTFTSLSSRHINRQWIGSDVICTLWYHWSFILLIVILQFQTVNTVIRMICICTHLLNSWFIQLLIVLLLYRTKALLSSKTHTSPRTWVLVSATLLHVKGLGKPIIHIPNKPKQARGHFNLKHRGWYPFLRFMIYLPTV